MLTVPFQKYMTGTMNVNETNFWIQAGYVDELVRGTKCNGGFDRNRAYETLTSDWRSWHRGEFDDSRSDHAVAPTVRKYPSFSADFHYRHHHYHHHYHHPPPLWYRFPRLFTRPFFSSIAKATYPRPQVDYTIIIDYDWRTRDTKRTYDIPGDEERTEPAFLEVLWIF